ncbi:MAG: proteinral secretion pathway protein D [Syntrophaceae bacterium]|nr:MAG: proteinral secretion pathway protein D [Syntrophaceae bacterium]
MKFVNNAIRTSALRFAMAAAFMICLAPPVFAARIDDGRPARQSSTVTPAATEEKSPAAGQSGKVVIMQPSGAALPEKSESEQAASEPAEAPQTDKTGAAPSSKVLRQETILRKAEDKASAKKAPAAHAIRKTTDQYVTLDFDNVNIEVFVKFISELTGKNFIIDEKVKGKVTILSPRKIPLRDVYKVFLSVLEINGFATVPVGDMIKIVPSVVAREKSVETRSKKDSSEPDDRMVTQIIALERANPDEVKRVLDPIISRSSSVLSYPPAGILIITDYLSNIRRLQEIVKALDVEGAGEQITYLPLQNASASEVAKSMTAVFQQRRPNLTPVRMVADPRTNSMIIFASVADTESVRKLVAMMDKDVPRGESNIQVYRLQNSIAEDLAKVLNNIIKETGSAAGGAAGAAAQRVATPVVSKNVQIVPDKATNTLVIMAEREDYKVLENIIKQLDVPRAMVYIEALIMEVKTNKDFKLGVEWRGVTETGSIDGKPLGSFIGSGTGLLPSVSFDTATNLASLALPAGFSMGIIGAGITIGGVLFPTIGAMVQAYKSDSDVSILSTPQILTLNNEEAEINVGSNVPYVTRQDQTNTSGVGGATNYSTYEYKDVGIILNITPHINEGNFVRLKISQQVTKVTSGVSTDTKIPSIPTTLKRTAKTTVVVKDNETVVIGGLVGDSTEDGTTGVPLFSNIPVLGWLFKAKTVKREKTNLYVFITPRIIRTQQDAAGLYQQKREAMGEVVEGIIKLNERKQDTYPSGVVKPDEKNVPANP